MIYVYLFTNTKLLNYYTYMYECVHDNNDIRMCIYSPTQTVSKVIHMHAVIDVHFHF